MPYRTQGDWVAAAQAAITTHQEAAGLEAGNGPSTDLWHLLASLMEWCDAKGVDFDATVSEVRADAPWPPIGPRTEMAEAR